MPRLVQTWRSVWWSGEPTNGPSEGSSGARAGYSPFGIVTLAAGTAEGHGSHMAALRWSQTGNYGDLPNPAMPDTFIGHAFDLGDPWANPAAYDQHCAKPPYGSGCVPWSTAGWNPAVAIEAPAVRNNTAPFFMGPIHPRFKRELGRRLAVAFAKNMSGPVIRGCSIDHDAHRLEIRFRPDRLGGEGIYVGPAAAAAENSSALAGPDSHFLYVCTDALGLTVANATSCGCLSWDYIYPWDAPHGDLWYCAEGPGWKPPPTAIDAHRRYRAAHPEHRPRANPFLAIWSVAPLSATADATGHPAVAVDLTRVNGTVLAVRYGWGGRSGDSCCPAGLVAAGLEVCRPAGCPLLSNVSFLPANPFFATVSNGTCRCPRPQVCDD